MKPAFPSHGPPAAWVLLVLETEAVLAQARVQLVPPEVQVRLAATPQGLPVLEQLQSVLAMTEQQAVLVPVWAPRVERV